MTDLSNYIDDYFQNALNETDKKAFEQRCATDQQFAEEVAGYIMARQAVRDTLLTQKKQQWSTSETIIATNVPSKTPLRSLFVRKLMPYALAACLLFAVILTYFNSNNNPQQIANTYLKEHIAQISITASGENDSLAIASTAYNVKDYGKALTYFLALHNSHPTEDKYLKYSGFVYLMTKDYDNAVQQFTELAGIQGLRSNPGRFLEAVTLILRNKEGDKAAAKLLLQEVADEKTKDSADAIELLKGL